MLPRGLGLGLQMKSRGQNAAETIIRDMMLSGIVTDLGDPAKFTITTTRATAAKCIFTGADLGNNVPCRRLIPLGNTGLSVYEYAVFQAVTRINDAALTAWTATGTAAVAAGAQSDYDYRLTLANGDTVYDDRTVTSGLKHYLGLRARKISGDCTGLVARFEDASDASAWSTVDLSGLTTAWAWYGNATAATDDTDGRVIIAAGAACVVEVQYVQLTAGIAATAHRLPFVPGSGAGVAKAADQVVITAALTSTASSIISAGTTYAHAIQNTLTPYPHHWYGGSAGFNCREAANYNPNIGGARPTQAANQAADLRTVLGLDWDRPTDNTCLHYIGGAGASSAAMTGTFSYSSIELGARIGTSRYLNGPVSLLRCATRRLSAAEHAAWSQVLGHGRSLAGEWMA